jgi:hypothetical protein
MLFHILINILFQFEKSNCSFALEKFITNLEFDLFSLKYFQIKKQNTKSCGQNTSIESNLLSVSIFFIIGSNKSLKKSEL